MSSNREQIVREALSLPPEDRAFVADALEQSLSHGGFASPDIADAWVEEIGRRLASFDRGETAAVDADLALDRLRQRLAARRAARTPS